MKLGQLLVMSPGQLIERECDLWGDFWVEREDTYEVEVAAVLVAVVRIGSTCRIQWAEEKLVSFLRWSRRSAAAAVNHAFDNVHFVVVRPGNPLWEEEHLPR